MIRVRPLEAADLDACGAIERAAYSDPWSPESLAEMLELEAGLALGAVDEPGAIVGYVMGWVAAGEAELANIAVDERRRGEGIGRSLLDAFARAAADCGARRIWLEVRPSNAAARKLYQGYGFVVVGRRPDYYESPAEDAVVMAVDVEDLAARDGA